MGVTFSEARPAGAGGISKLVSTFEIHAAHSQPVPLIEAYQLLWDRMLSTRGKRGESLLI